MDQNLIQDLLNAKISEKSDHIIDGKGVLEIRSHSFGPKEGDPRTFIAEFSVVSAESKGDLMLEPFAPGEAHLTANPPVPAPCNTPGQTVGWVQQCTKHKSALGNVIGYVCKLAGVAKEQMTPDKLRAALGEMTEQNALKGVRVGFETYRQATKSGANAGRINTYVRFHPITNRDENDPNSNHPKQVARRRAEQK